MGGQELLKSRDRREKGEGGVGLLMFYRGRQGVKCTKRQKAIAKTTS